MLKKICWILGFHMCLWLYPVYAQGVVVAVPSEIRVDGAQLTLGELAEITGEEEERIAVLRQIKLGSAPAPGSSLVLSRDMLGVRLAASGVDLSGITWQVPDSITIISDGQVVSRQLLVGKAIDSIQSLSGVPKGSPDLTITLEGNPQDIVVPKGKADITISLPSGIRYTGVTTAQAVISVNGKLAAKIPLRFDVKLYRQVVVAARPLGIKEVLTADALRYERMDVGRLSGGYYTQLDKLAGLAVRRAVTPGTPITDLMLEKPVIIKRGKTVSIVARIGDLEVSAAGQAMQDGVEGQFIRVKNTSSGRMVSGKVIDASTVEVNR